MALTKRFGNIQPFVQPAGADRETGFSLGVVTYEPNLDGGEDYQVTSFTMSGRSDHLMDGINAFRDVEVETLTTSTPLECDKTLIRAKADEPATATTTKVVVKPSDAVLTEAVA